MTQLAQGRPVWRRVLDFLKGLLAEVPETVEALPAPEKVSAEDFTMALHFRAKRGNAVRLGGRPRPSEELPALLADVALSGVEVLEARSTEFSDAAPALERPRDAMQWLQAHGGNGPVARHALRVLETVGAIDLAVDTIACTLLHGELDASGYPEEDAVVGGLASRWDEGTGDLLVRAVVAWGGTGLRGDTERAAQRLLTGLDGRIVARARAAKVGAEGEVAEGAEAHAQVCSHCGFALAGERAMFCPKCGMRLTQG